jgi:muramoyltetrapeptide carboxypeptidase
MAAAVLPLPPALKAGDRVQLAAISSALDSATRLEAGLAILRQWGLLIETDPAALVGRRWGYLAGDDGRRRADLQAGAAAAPLLACVRGGWGAARLLEPPGPPQRPGWLLGFSDVSAMLLARVAAGLGGGVHGPLVTTLAAEPAWSQERLRSLLFGEPVADLEGEGWLGGAGPAEGPLLVANLTVATHLLGTPFLPGLAGAILIIEDVGEQPYRIDRMLSHWRLAGALQQLAGLGFGSFSNCIDHDRDGDPASHRFSVEEVLRERCGDLGIPLVAGLAVGHAPGNGALPLGVRARLDGHLGRLSLL